MHSPADSFRFPVQLSGIAASRTLRDSSDGRVAALFESSFYVNTRAGLVCVGNESLAPSPLTLVTTAPAGTHWPASGLRLNAGVSISARTIGVGNRFVFPLSEATEWSPDPVPDAWQPLDLERGVRAFREAAVGRVPTEGLGSFLIPGQRFARQRRVCRIAETPVAALRRCLVTAFREPDKSAMPELQWLHPLVGLGPGLTPSGDDFIGGMMIALHGLCETDLCRHVWKSVRGYVEEAGNPISGAHLEAASEGQGSAGIHRALAAILGGCPQATRDSLADIERIGHVSGWDTMAGVIVTLDAWLEARHPRA
ncbi:MAG: hypothetical protein BMS9Abin01_0441 [Gammaproteobacteria bacterium]|nr:MAG: hypothetical protein BMS9Abin01_0441 [Gammaproteobacteria bacterium]